MLFGHALQFDDRFGPVLMPLLVFRSRASIGGRERPERVVMLDIRSNAGQDRAIQLRGVILDAGTVCRGPLR